MTCYLALLMLFVWVQRNEATLSCLSCANVRNVSECVNSITCGQHEKCYTATSGRLGDRYFTLGCQSEQACQGQTATAGLIGRKRRATTDSNCHQCCAVDGCNNFLCTDIDKISATVSETCEDSPSVDCSVVSRAFPVCADVQHAKQICKKWCGFCGIVDGNWTDWSAWSSCSVTCGDGHMTRTRTCTNPKPSPLGGHDCLGNNSDDMTCHHRTACEVNGGWGDWLSWGACSVSCGAGIRRRKRDCDSPVPVKNGHYCYGEANDYDSCLTTTCDVKPPSVVFYIRNVQHRDIASGAKVLYRTTLVDTSGSYNSSTGVFTAPVTGLYTFTVTVSVYSKHYIGLQITTTSAPGHLGELYHDQDYDSTTSTMTGVGELQAGSQVWVQCIYAGTSGTDLYDSPSLGDQNSFQGALIRVL